MTKSELIEKLHKAMTFTHDRSVNKTDVAAFLEALDEVASQALCEGDAVPLPGLGKLTVVDKAARAGRNPRTGEAIEIEARRVVRFQPITGLKTAVLGQPER